jgi:hypothetical protein
LTPGEDPPEDYQEEALVWDSTAGTVIELTDAQAEQLARVTPRGEFVVAAEGEELPDELDDTGELDAIAPSLEVEESSAGVPSADEGDENAPHA